MGDLYKSQENQSSLQTGKAVRNSNRVYSGNPQYRKTSAKSKKRRDSTHNGDAPIYFLNPDDLEPEFHPIKFEQTSSGKYRDHVLLYLFAGYILGILLVVIWYYRNHQKASSDLGGKWFFIVLFFLLMVILTHQRPARCIAVLCLPTLAHCQSQAAIVALAFMIAFLGPVMNIIRNVNIMAYSLDCGQSRLTDAIKSMHHIINDPLHSMGELIQRSIVEGSGILKKLDYFFMKLENPIAYIYATYETGTSWLALQNDQFDYRMGAPYTRCLRAGNLSLFQCKTQFGQQAKKWCNPSKFAWLCKNLRGLKSFFNNYLSFPQINIENISERLQICFLQIRLMFSATISFNHSLKPNTSLFLIDQNLTCNQHLNKQLEAADKKFFYINSGLYLIVFILVLSVILRSIDFRFRYLMSEHFDNVYITRDFEVYEEQQSQIMGVRVLPLNSFEENKYVKITSLKLLPDELKTMFCSVTFMFITGIQLLCLCLVDYGLYSTLALMSYHGNITVGIQASTHRKLIIQGGGRVGDLLRDFVQAFEPKTLQMDFNKCLPVPENPKNVHYIWIAVLYVLAWIMVLCEPYGLRQRHRIMAYFYPEESKQRVQYLHYTILQERKSVLHLGNQRARFLNCYMFSSDVLSCITFLRSLARWFLSGCRVAFLGRSCTVCRNPLTKTDYIFCGLSNCTAVYCNTCFNEANNYCILCGSLSECGFSEIGDSSDEYDCCSPDNIECR